MKSETLEFKHPAEIAPASSTVLITGASSGIGLALAREFARHGHPLIIAAPVAAEIKQVAEQLSRDFGVDVEPLTVDFRDVNAAQNLYDKILSLGLQVEILANNAGVGQRGKFWENSPDRDIEMLRVNVEAGLRLMRLFLPDMVAQGHGRVLNTASIAGFEPGPLLATYHATKAFMLSLSESVATELEGTGVAVTALCPGPIDTDFFPKADMVDTKVFQSGPVMAPQEVAEAAYPAVIEGRRQIVPGAMNKALVVGRRMMSLAAQSKANKKMYEDADPSRRHRERGDVEAKVKR